MGFFHCSNIVLYKNVCITEVFNLHMLHILYWVAILLTFLKYLLLVLLNEYYCMQS